MSHLNHFLTIVLFFIQFYPICYAEITFDGTTGPKIELSGPDYLISADNGKLRGNNLFHSFDKFNLNKGESATFTGANLSIEKSIENIIGRITGDSRSEINGLLKSEIPNADLYLLNPNGFLLGSKARLEINGSIYLSSASYLRFSGEQKFYANTSKSTIFSSAPPEAFGFLKFKHNIGKIKIRDFNNNNKYEGYNKKIVNEGEKLTIIGANDIKIINSKLYAPKGDINIVSAASNGEITSYDVTDNTLTGFGNVEIIDGTLDVNARERKSGSIVILSGHFFMTNSKIKNLGVTGTGNIKITFGSV
jgi:filamentous hemagglutinin family protein